MVLPLSCSNLANEEVQELEALTQDPLWPPMDYYANRGGIWSNYSQAKFEKVVEQLPTREQDGEIKTKTQMAVVEPQVDMGRLRLTSEDEDEEED